TTTTQSSVTTTLQPRKDTTTTQSSVTTTLQPRKDATTTQSTITYNVVEAAQQSNSAKAAIVGGVVGVVLLMIIVVGCIACFRRWKTRRAGDGTTEKESTDRDKSRALGVHVDSSRAEQKTWAWPQESRKEETEKEIQAPRRNASFVRVTTSTTN
ncbi:hypothetical protein PFISCL1PPCAC_3337, partial [Pristionchus fissidentatus]